MREPARPNRHDHNLLSNRLRDRVDEAQKLIWDLVGEPRSPLVSQAIWEANDLLRTLTDAAQTAQEEETP